MLTYVIISVIAVIIVGLSSFALGWFVRNRQYHHSARLAAESADRLIDEAKNRQRELLLEARDEALRIKSQAEAEIRDRRAELHRQERRLQQKEETLDRRIEVQDRRERALAEKEHQVETLRQQLEELKKERQHELERIAHLTMEEAREIVLHEIEQEVKADAARRVREIEQQAREEADRRARMIIALAIQRCAAEQVAETTVSVVPLPNEEMKGRIIGREGRNIRALESATGVDVIIDDTPDAVTLSGFDPIRREIARIALQKLIADGRIHPARIEEVVAKARQEVENIIREEGEQAALKAGVHGLHPELIKFLGRLKFRTSYGQNILTHSIEVAHLSAALAAELGADVNVARTAGLLHDIGKALSHEVEGPHALVGAELVRRYSKSPKIAAAVGNHHGEMDEPQSLEAIIVQAADAISGARPGARRETVENYIKRLEALESVANSFPGVERSFAIQAGREVRIIVKPEEVDDLSAVRLARDVVKRIEETLEYPGQIKVTVLRETRAVDYAR
ncbi:MAG TPA: ribonuclease Y [Chloroflexota bacterium]|jgi:ribonuclease Y|nr:ribonuclease Y [Chloroflexota bacterium]